MKQHKQRQAMLLVAFGKSGLVHCVGHRQALPQCFVFVSSFGTEGFPFDLRNGPAPVKVCSALLGASKETSVKERW